MVVFSPDGRQCRIIQGETDRPFPSKNRKALEEQVLQSTSPQPVYRGLALFIERCRRILVGNHGKFTLQEPLERDTAGGQRYAIFSLLVVLAAFFLTIRRRWQCS